MTTCFCLARVRSFITESFELHAGRYSGIFGIGFSILFERNRRAVYALHESRRLARKAEAKANFMVQLNETLLRLETPEQIMAASVRMLGEYLKVDRCGYAEIDHDKDQFVVKAEYVAGAVSSILGCYTLSEFGQNEQQILKDHSAYIVSDIEADPPPERTWHSTARDKSGLLVCVPLKRTGVAGENGRPAQHAAALVERRNRSDNRSGNPVLRISRTRQSGPGKVKDNEERYRAFIANSSEGSGDLSSNSRSR